ncbi:DNA polymerase [Vibrio lentus]|nr:DNA polymerase [Vibrio lentus]
MKKVVIRQAFVAVWLEDLAVDYSQIELRIMAHLSGDGVTGEHSNKAKISTRQPLLRSLVLILRV